MATDPIIDVNAFVAELQALDAPPGSVVVLRLNEIPTLKVAEAMVDQLRRAFPDHQVLVLSPPADEVTFEVVSDADHLIETTAATADRIATQIRAAAARDVADHAFETGHLDSTYAPRAAI